jgi:membrane protein DedA with SNARE-associated domain
VRPRGRRQLRWSNVLWATTVGLAGYFIGQSTTGVFTIVGIVGLSVALLAMGILFARSRRARPSPKPAAEKRVA